jgi:hypothetical protein
MSMVNLANLPPLSPACREWKVNPKRRLVCNIFPGCIVRQDVSAGNDLPLPDNNA